MGAPGRAVELAGDAPLHADRDAVDLHVPVERGPEVVVSVLVRGGPGDDAGVHECGQAEVHQDEDGDDAFEEGNGPSLLLKQVPLNATGEINGGG